MNYTYNSLRELAIPAVTFASTEMPEALLVLIDALLEAGVLLPWSQNELSTADQQRRAEQWMNRWAMGWAMKAVYGASNVKASPSEQPRLETSAETDAHHRKWSEERIALRRVGVKFRGTMKRAEIDAALAGVGA